MTDPTAQSDEAEAKEFLRRVREGDADAFCTLAQAHEQRLFQQALALCRNAAHAEDLAAETLIAAWKSIARFDGQCRFSTWLYAILLHRYQKLVRRQRSRPVPLSALPQGEMNRGEQLLQHLADTQMAGSDRLMQAEADAHLRQAVAALPDKHRRVVLLRFYADATLPEIALALDLSVGTVKSRLHHALEKLRRMQSVERLLHPSAPDEESPQSRQSRS